METCQRNPATGLWTQEVTVGVKVHANQQKSPKSCMVKGVDSTGEGFITGKNYLHSPIRD